MPTRPARKKSTPTAAERKRRAAQKPDQPAETPVEEQPPQGGETPNGVLVSRIALEDGVNYRFMVTPIGDVRATEIGDILAYGLRDHRKKTDPE